MATDVLDAQTRIRLYGIIGTDVTSASVAEMLSGVGGDLTVHINSRGGDVFEGVAILNLLRAYKGGRVTTIVDGLAASAASFIAMGGDEIVMNRNSEMMVHNGHALAVGGAEEMRKTADQLDRANANMATIYAARAGGTTDQWRALMAAETWFSAEEAVKAGLADRVESTTSEDGRMLAAAFDLTIFAHAGRINAPAPVIPQAHQTPLPNVEAEEPQGKEPTVASLKESVLQKLGLDADADEAAIENAIAELVDRATTDPEPAEPTLDQAIQIAANADLATISTEALEALKVEARAGAEARAQQVRESDERVVDAAIADGKIAPARRDHHIAALAADRVGHTAVLAALQPGLVPITEKGHGVTAEITNEDDAIYASLFGKDA
jgi:ATP-dependent protease ClpP protease subunit